MVYNALAAAAVGKIYGLTGEEIRRGIEDIRSMEGRFHVEKIGDVLLIDDSYNANPVSMMGSVDTLSQAAGRRVAILGDMGELGEEEALLHVRVGEHVAASDVDEAVFVGTLAREMAEAAKRSSCRPGQRIIYEPDVDTLLSHLDSYVQKGDTVLVKASHFMGLERVVKVLKEKKG